MIGYILSMSQGKILDEVNGDLEAVADFGSAPPLSFREDDEADVAQTDQPLERPQVVPRDFVLRHFWVDLRS
jgi:hypothetical protein